MKLLLDTHAFIWWDHDPAQLSAPALAAVRDPANDGSAASSFSPGPVTPVLSRNSACGLLSRASSFRPASVMPLKFSRKPAVNDPPTRIPGRVWDFSPNSTRIATVQVDGTVQVYETQTAKKRRDLGKGPPATRIAFHPSGKQLAMAVAGPLRAFHCP